MTQNSNAPDPSSPLASQKPVTTPDGVSAQVGQTLDQRYRLISLLGTGGMGSVYLARHVVIGKPVAVKILDSRLVTEAQGAQRLFREAQAAAARYG